MPVRGRNAGNKGQGSKWISKTRRRKIYERDGWRCVWCLVRVCDVSDCMLCAGATLDHIVPRSEGGSHATNNLITCCMGCNRLRGSTPWFDFALVLARGGLGSFELSRAAMIRELRRAARPTRYRIRRILNTNWGF